MIEQLLFETNTKPTIKTSLKNENFLLSLLKEAKNPKELLKSLNIKISDLEKIIKKLPKNEQKEIKDILKNLKSNEDSSPLKQDINIINPLQQPTKEPVQIKEIKKDIKDEPKIVEFIKKEITAKIKSKEIILSKAKINEFKQIKTLKELINFSNKNGLNIQKIIYSKEIENKTNFSQKPIKEPPAKIVINNEIKNKPQLKTNKKFQLKTDNKNNKTQKKEILTNIINTNVQEKKYITKPLNKEVKAKADTRKVLQTKSHKTIINKLLKQSNHQQKINETPKNNEKEIIKSYISQLLNNTPSTNIEKNIDIQQNFSQEVKTKEIKNESSNHQIELNTTPQIIKELKQNITKAKQSLKHFANNLKEAIQEYKPPIHKLSIELNPKELGKVEVTLLHRGDNLQIQINSQPSTINFFNTHQNELKNILANLGYSEVNMSFNSNQQHQQKQQYKQNQQKFSSKEEDSFIIEIPYKYA